MAAPGRRRRTDEMAGSVRRSWPGRLLPFLLVLLLAPGRPAAGQDLPLAPPARLGLDPERLERIVTLVKEAVDRQEIAGAVTLVARLGRVGHLEAVGWRDVERRAPMETGTLFRIASMTKAVTSVAAMQLYESGALLLDDPVSRYLPAFAAVEVLAPGDAEPRALDRPITIRHLLTHTSGLGYRFLAPPRLAARYAAAGISDGLAQTPGTLGEMVDRLAALPLLHQPGERFTYGLGVDVLGRVVEVVAGRSLADHLQETIFEPLGMVDTAFYRGPADAERFASVYAPGPDGLVKAPDAPVSSADGRTVYSAGYPYAGPRTYHSGGAGLSSTISDYARFLLALLNGGELDGARILGRRTVQLMTRDHLAGLGAAGDGRRFGLGFAIAGDPGATGGPRSEGAFGWLGFFNTVYWVDPEEQLVAIIMTQLYPNDRSRLTDRFEVAVYSAIVN